jgi:dolichol-phosphate mannosyltransferase
MPLTKPHAPSGRPDVSVILPTFQERDNIVPLVDQLRQEFKRIDARYEILVVDDKSPDGTAMAARSAFADDRGVVVIERSSDPGLALSIREGIEKSHGAVVLVFPRWPSWSISASARGSSSAAECRTGRGIS